MKLSDGPTLSFRVERYSLMKDLLKTSKRSRSVGMEYLSRPWYVLAVQVLNIDLNMYTARPRLLPSAFPKHTAPPPPSS